MSNKKTAAAVTDIPEAVATAPEVTAAVTDIPEAVAPAPEVTADPADPANIPPTAYIIRALRPQGIWRAGRFWGPDEVTVRADQFTPEQEVKLITEPLLLAVPLIETQE